MSTITVEQINQAKVSELREYAKQLGVKGYSRTKKADLVAQLIEVLQSSESQETEQTEQINPAVEWSEKVLKMTNIKEVKQACQDLIERLKLNEMMPKSRKNKTRAYTNPFKELNPTPETKHLFYEYQAQGKSKPVIRHIVFNLLELDDYAAKNEKIREERKQKTTTSQEIAHVFEEEDKVFSVEKYFSATKTVINSNNPWELGVGLIATSGRRLIEIIYRGEFEIPAECPPYIQHSEYCIRFTGQAKKRDERPVIYISLLVPTKQFLETFKRFRALPEIKELVTYAEDLRSQKYSEQEINKKIESRVGNSLRRVITTYFEFMPKIEEENSKNISLRAAYSKLVTIRDMGNKNFKSQLRYTGYMLGHLTPILDSKGRYRHDTKKEQRLSSTLLYGDYEPDNNHIPFINKDMFLTTIDTDKIVEELATITDNRVADLERYVKELEEKLERRDETIKSLELEVKQFREKKKLDDVENLDNRRLFKTRKSGSSQEKIDRVWKAILEYNENALDNKICPTSQVLSQLSGVNRQIVSKWVKQHQVIYDDYFAKNNFSTYYNIKYRNQVDMNVEIILEIIERDYLKIYVE